MATTIENSLTKTKIIDVAERLFAEKSIDGVSIRMIVAEAEVNLAAIHYHFGSKEDLLKAVLHRFVDRVNNQRLTLLDELERANETLEVEQIIGAFLIPVSKWVKQEPEKIKSAMKIVSQIHSDPMRFQNIVGDIFGEVARRFLIAFKQAMPELSETELTWRFKFMLGSMFAIVTNAPLSKKLGMTGAPQNDMKKSLTYVANFVAAGFRAPATNK